MNLSSSVGRSFRCALLALNMISGPTVGASAQDSDFFRPTIEKPVAKKPVGREDVYSFSRLVPYFTPLCVELEREGRLDRVLKITEAAMARDKSCVTCRSFWKMVVEACGHLGPKPTRVPKPDKGATRVAQASLIAEEAGEPPTKEDHTGASPVAQATKPVGERYPSVVMLDIASRLSAAMYEIDSGEGPTANMFQYFGKTILEHPGLTPIERGYYDLLLTYLLAAWDGRIDETKLPPPTPSSILREMFSSE